MDEYIDHVNLRIKEVEFVLGEIKKYVNLKSPDRHKALKESEALDDKVWQLREALKYV